MVAVLPSNYQEQQSQLDLGAGLDVRERALIARDALSELAPSLRATDEAKRLVGTLSDLATGRLAGSGPELRAVQQQLRVLFYVAIDRRPPTDLRSLPSYVTSVKRRFGLPAGNDARRVLAHMEGFRSWRELVASALRAPD